MILQGENILLGLQLATSVATKGFDYYLSHKYSEGLNKTTDGILSFANRITYIYEKSSYTDSETIEYMNVINRDTVANILSVYINKKLMGTFKLEIGEALRYNSNFGFEILTIDGVPKSGDTGKLNSIDMVAVAGSTVTLPALLDGKTVEMIMIDGAPTVKDTHFTQFSNSITYNSTTLLAGGEKLKIFYK